MDLLDVDHDFYYDDPVTLDHDPDQHDIFEIFSVVLEMF
jgi:hypothetical protein